MATFVDQVTGEPSEEMFFYEHSEYKNSSALSGGDYIEHGVEFFDSTVEYVGYWTTVDWDFDDLSGYADITTNAVGPTSGLYYGDYASLSSGGLRFNLSGKYIIPGTGSESVYFDAEAWSNWNAAYCTLSINGISNDCHNSFQIELGKFFTLELDIYLNGQTTPNGANESTHARYDLTSVRVESTNDYLKMSDVPEPSTFLLSLLPLALIGFRKASRKS